MRSDDKIRAAILKFTDYLVDAYRDSIKDISNFYRKFVYMEEPDDSDDYQTDDF